MLEGIVFILADEGRKESVMRLTEKLGKERKKLSVSVRMKAAFLLSEEPEEAGENGGVLFVTDDGTVLRMLLERGKKAVAFLHGNNREEEMSGAPFAVSHIEELDAEYFESAYLRMAGLPLPVARTKRCIIREMTVADVDAFYEIYAEPSITRYMDGLYEDPEQERQYTRDYIREIYGFYGYGLWSVVHRESGRIIGRAGLSLREGFSLPELGFVIAVPFQKKGYGYEVCRAVLSYGKRKLGFQEVQALILDGNAASVKLCEKLGFFLCDRVESRGKIYNRYLWKSPDGAA